ncbi:phage protein [Vibrio phage pTD1]|uniref:Phage protein n=1 Tax=Vibrio phage pTD1 TaxID=1938577 RepID=A0A1Q2U2R1_9CAUD|nr:baseplate assembly protein [Vibrio phage pTD1]BAW98252.1 phage protein [Vibrio phage pTD1]
MNLLNFVGVGTVVENKPEKSYFVKVTVKREFPQADGAGLANATQESVSNPTADGGYQTSNVLKSNFYMPKWMPFNPNRITAPDVRVGSKVAIYKFADNDQLYWTTWGIGNESFRLEHVVYAWNANPNFDKNAPFSFDDYYTLVFSTRHQEVVFKTTQANKEPVAYRLGFNTKNGTWALTDTEKNAFALDSLKHSWVMRNWEGSIFNIHRKNISMINKGTQLFEADESINMKTDKMYVTCNELTMHARDFMKLTTKDYSLTTTNTVMKSDSLSIDTSSFDIKSKTANWKSDSISITCPTNSIKGNVGIQGNLGVAGGMSCSAGPGGSGGTLVTSGGIVADKIVESKVDVVAAGISLKSHTHTGNKGAPTSPPLGA